MRCKEIKKSKKAKKASQPKYASHWLELMHSYFLGQGTMMIAKLVS